LVTSRENREKPLIRSDWGGGGTDGNLRREGVAPSAGISNGGEYTAERGGGAGAQGFLQFL
jgi:hypothetical protein